MRPRHAPPRRPDLPGVTTVSETRRLLPLSAVPESVAATGAEPGCSRLSRMFRAAPVALVEVDADQRVLLWNRAAERLFGWTAAEVLGMRNPLLPDAGDAADEIVAMREQALAADGTAVAGSRFEARRPHKDGRLLDVEVLLTAVTDADGRLTGWIAAFTDNSERTALRSRLDARMRQQAAVAALGRTALGARSLQPVLDAAIACVVATLGVLAASVLRREPDGSLVFAATYGYTVPDDGHETYVAGRPPPLAARVLATGEPFVVDDLTAPGAPVPRWAAHLISGCGARSSALVLVGGVDAPWGTLGAHAPTVGAFGPDDLVFLRAVANIVAEAAARCAVEEEVRHRASHDALTGLPNRDLLGERLAEALRGRGSRRSDGYSALLLVDLDGFKDVNDSQGHQTGDEILRQVGARLTGRLRSTDTVARLGGDEFAVLLTDLPAPDHAAWVAAELGSLLRLPYTTPQGPVGLAGSIGIAIAGRGACDPFELLRRADAAMYRAKRERCGHAVHDAALDDGASARLGLVSELRTALEEEALTLHYQPVVDLGHGGVTSVEALVRWTHPTLGPQSPAEFVALAESSGLAGDLTDLVVRTASRQWAAWAQDGLRIPVAVNLSPILLRADGFADYLVRSVVQAGMPLDRLRIEVTETALAHEGAVDVLRDLRRRGIRVAIDDFGTGWSSLGRLKQLPVDTIKIDRSFVTGLVEDRRDAAIVRSVVALASELGLRTIAEGVETTEVAHALRDLGVDRAQGYLYARPLPPDELRSWYDARVSAVPAPRRPAARRPGRRPPARPADAATAPPPGR